MGEKNLKRSRREIHESKLKLLRELRSKCEQTGGQIYSELFDSVRGQERGVVADVIAGFKIRLGQK